MPRPLRPVADGLVYHALNRGNNRERVFLTDGDYQAFLRALGQTQLRYPFRADVVAKGELIGFFRDAVIAHSGMDSKSPLCRG